MSALTHTNPPGSCTPYKNLFSNATIIPAGAKLAYISTQFSSDADGNLIDGSYFEQSKKTWENVMVILKGLGCGLEDIVHRRVSYTEFSEEIGQQTVQGGLAAVGQENAKAFLQSSLAYQGFSHFHFPGIKVAVELVVMIPEK